MKIPIAQIKNVYLRRIALVTLAAPIGAIYMAPALIQMVLHALSRAYDRFRWEISDCAEDAELKLLPRAFKAMWAPDWKSET